MSDGACGVSAINCYAFYGGIVVLSSYAVLCGFIAWRVKNHPESVDSMWKTLWRGIDIESVYSSNFWTISASSAALSYLFLARGSAPTHPRFDGAFLALCISATLWSFAVMGDVIFDMRALGMATTATTALASIWFIVAIPGTDLDTFAGFVSAIFIAFHHVVVDGFMWNNVFGQPPHKSPTKRVSFNLPSEFSRQR